MRLSIERRNSYVRDHYGVHARFNRTPEGRKLDRIKPGPVARHLRDAQMRVDSRIAMPRKMLGRCGDAPSLLGCDEASPQPRDESRAPAVRAGVLVDEIAY